MLNIVVGGILLVMMTMGFFLACLVAVYNFRLFIPYKYEIFGMIVNALVGAIGFGVYITYLPVLGEVRLTTISRLEFVCTNPSRDCVADAFIINTYTILSSVRFLFWYGEFLTSFLFIVFNSSYRRLMTFLRYLVHALNTSFSAITFGIVASSEFPRDRVFGGKNTAPVVVQMLLLVWAMMSFWFIAQSPLYRVPCMILRPLYIPKFAPFWRQRSGPHPAG